MPFYYFDLIENGVLTRDDVGIDLVDVAEAREQAQAILPEMARAAATAADSQVFVCEVREAEGGPIYRGSLTYRGTFLAAS